MKVEVAVLGSPSLISPTVSVDVKQHSTNQRERQEFDVHRGVTSNYNYTAAHADAYCNSIGMNYL